MRRPRATGGREVPLNTSLPPLVAHLVAHRAIGPLERHLVGLLQRVEPVVDERVLVAAALASRALADGHLCLDVREAVTGPLFDVDGEPVDGWTWPEPEAWLAALRTSPVVSDGAARAPIVVRGGLVYLARYAAREAHLARRLEALALAPVPAVDGAALDALLDAMFAGAWENPEQRAAVRAALARALVVLAGGPGTGKTTTVVRLLAALVDQARRRGEPDPRVLLVAPTGKAAARMGEAIRANKRHLAELPPDLLDAVPDEASTVHRALRVDQRASPFLTEFVHGERRPLAADVVLVDELSMVDLPLLDSLVSAVRPGARLILLGDPDQLPSVGVGAVLGELCALPRQTPVGACVSTLRTSRRFDAGGGVGRLARAMHDPARPRPSVELVREVLEVFDDPDGPALLRPSTRADRDPALLQVAVDGWRRFCEAKATPERLDRLDAFRVLCATRVGRCGVEAIGPAIEEALAAEGLVPKRRRGWYEGQPLLITANDYEVDLYNGDTGVIVRDQGRLEAVFRRGGAELRVAPARLPRHETVWAMTVHKSQGSEFDEVLVVLPDGDHRVLGRELLYTAVTRAKARVAVHASREVLATCVARRTRRVSGLGERLGGDGRAP